MPAGFQSAFDKPRPPHIRFEREALERRDAAGRVLYVDVDMAYITQPGGVDTVPKLVEEWIPQIKRAADNGQYPHEWIPKIEAQYEAWKAKTELPVDGTPVKNWPAASAAEIKMLINVGLTTVEDLSQINEQVMARIGMGARSLKQRAQDFLSAQSGPGAVAAKLDALGARISTLELEGAKKDGTIAALQSQLAARGGPLQEAPAPAPAAHRASLSDRLSQAQSNVERSTARDDDLVKDVVDDILA